MSISTRRHPTATGLVIALSLGILAVFAAEPVVGQGRVPPNASPAPGGGWVCNDGYIKRGDFCVAVADATDAEVRQLMIARSIAAYSGSCPCPYNTDRAGRRCGARSAYSRPGGASPLCYETDITDTALKQFRAKYSATNQNR